MLYNDVSRERLDGQDKPNQPCTARIVSSATSEFAQGVIWKEVKRLTRRRKFFEITVLFENDLGVLTERLKQVLKDIHYHSAMRKRKDRRNLFHQKVMNCIKGQTAEDTYNTRISPVYKTFPPKRAQNRIPFLACGKLCERKLSLWSALGTVNFSTDSGTTSTHP